MISKERKDLFIDAAQTAAAVRQRSGLDPFDPLCIYDLCEQVGVTVRFIPISMEGMYDRVPKPRIHLSSLRPCGRRVYTCAHELGHHVYGHGTTIDSLQDEANTEMKATVEVLVDSFAANLLMPLPGMKKAFRVRQLTAETATPAQIYAIACNFGVGFRTLVEHLRYSVSLLSETRASELRRWSPKDIRDKMLPQYGESVLKVVDLHWTGCPVDAENGELLLCPAKTTVNGNLLRLLDSNNRYSLFRCENVGIGRLTFPDQQGEHFLRIQPPNYVGLVRYRHLDAVD